MVSCTLGAISRSKSVRVIFTTWLTPGNMTGTSTSVSTDRASLAAMDSRRMPATATV